MIVRLWDALVGLCWTRMIRRFFGKGAACAKASRRAKSSLLAPAIRSSGSLQMPGTAFSQRDEVKILFVFVFAGFVHGKKQELRLDRACWSELWCSTRSLL